jgi:carbamoyl-phosphate synthase large subunit
MVAQAAEMDIANEPEVDRHERFEASSDNRRPGRPSLNVLVVAAGRRTSLVRAFGEVANERGGKVLASDADSLAPALYLADEAFRTPRTGDPMHLPALLEIVRDHDVRLMVPTIDTDLPVLAANEAAFGALGCRVAISAGAFVAITLDKHATVARFGAAGLTVPRSWLPPLDATSELPERVFVKPRQGSASQNTYEVARSDLAAVLPMVPDPIVQEVLRGPEITIDALLDFEGRPIHYVPRRRIKTLAGESVQGVTLEHDPEFEAWIEEVLDACSGLGAAGPLTVQAFLTADGPVLSEINARFGGGYPLGLAAGGAYPAWLMDMVDGRPVEPRLGQYEAGLYMTRYHIEAFTRTPKW